MERHARVQTRGALAPFLVRLTGATLSARLKSKERVFLFLPPGAYFSRGWVQSAKFALQLGVLEMLSRAGLRVVRVGASLGRLSRVDAWLERRLAKLCAHYSLRDPVSRERARALGIEKASESVDLAFALDCDDARTPRAGLVVLSFRRPVRAQESDKILERVRALGSGAQFVLCHQVPEDASFMSELEERLRNEAQSCRRVSATLELAEARALYGDAERVLSNRLHVLMIALACGARAELVAEHDSKVRDALGALVDSSPDAPDAARVHAIFAANRARAETEIAALFERRDGGAP